MGVSQSWQPFDHNKKQDSCMISCLCMTHLVVAICSFLDRFVASVFYPSYLFALADVHVPLMIAVLGIKAVKPSTFSYIDLALLHRISI